MKIVLFALAILILIFISVRYLEQKSLYYPLRKIEVTPEHLGLGFEDITLTTKDGLNISGWFIPAVSPRAVIILCHGNGGNISHRLEKIKILNGLDLDILIFDYRGYGTSEGSPSEEGLYLDAEAVYEYLVKEKRIPYQKIIGYGESLGGAVVVDLASGRKMGGVIIEDSFTSAREMGKKVFPFIPTFIYKSRFDLLHKLKSIRIPKLIFHSVDDEIIPFEHGRRLFESASEPKEFIWLSGGHNDAFLVSEDLYRSGIDSFVKDVMKRF